MGKKPKISTGLKVFVLLFRFLVGATFIISGVAKCIDLWGTVFKMEEYLAVWGWELPRMLVTTGAFALSVAEGLLGVMMLTGCYRRTTTWMMLATMAFMLPLTVYIALDNPVHDCGCFGDFLVVSNMTTMWKNVALTAMLVYLAFFNHRVVGLYHPYSQWIAGLLTSAWLIVIAGYGYIVQPLVDFRRFDVGESIAGSTSSDDNVDYEFIYEKDGRRETFSVDNLPDSTWTFVSREVVGGKENSSEDDGIALYDAGGENITADYEDGRYVLVSVPEPARVGMGVAQKVDRLRAAVGDCGVEAFVALGGGEEEVARYDSITAPDYDVYYAEPTQLKELARGEVSVVALRDGRVEWKRSLDSFNIEDLKSCELEDFEPLGPITFWTLTLFYVIAMFTLLVMDQTGKLIFRLVRRKRLTRLRLHRAKKSKPAE